MDECRKQFEREVDSFGLSLERTEDGGGYTTATTEAAWWGWKSAYQAGMREAAKICEMQDGEHDHIYAQAIREAAEMVEANHG